MDDAIIATNPCTRIKARDLPRSMKVRKRMLTLDAQEVQRLVGAAESLFPSGVGVGRGPIGYGALIEFAAWTGLRSGEIAGLRMGSLNLLLGKVEVRESLSEVGGLMHSVPPKAYEDREVALLPPHVPRLRAYLNAQPPKGPDDFVFTEPDGSQLRHVGWFYPRVFRPAVKAAGLPAALRFHDLRHSRGTADRGRLAPARHLAATRPLDHHGHDGPLRASASEPGG